jgi:hypothetical protein
MEDLRIALVHAEPCLAFVDDVEVPGEVCEACGWLVDEHAVSVAA